MNLRGALPDTDSVVCRRLRAGFEERFFLKKKKRSLLGASKPKLRRFEIRCFCDKMKTFMSNFNGYLLENPHRCVYFYIQSISKRLSMKHTLI